MVTLNAGLSHATESIRRQCSGPKDAIMFISYTHCTSVCGTFGLEGIVAKAILWINSNSPPGSRLPIKYLDEESTDSIMKTSKLP